MKDKAQLWLNRYPVLDEAHVDDLDMRAANHEMKGRKPRDQAEAAAHADYVRERALDSATHHLIGIRAAVAAGQDDASSAHGEAYAAAMKAAGHDPFQPPPQEVMDRLKANRPKVYSFKAHPADQFFVPAPAEADPADLRIQQLMGHIKALSDQVGAKKP